MTVGDLSGGDPKTYRWLCKVLQLDREEWDRSGGPSRDNGRPQQPAEMVQEGFIKTCAGGSSGEQLVLF